MQFGSEHAPLLSICVSLVESFEEADDMVVDQFEKSVNVNVSADEHSLLNKPASRSLMALCVAGFRVDALLAGFGMRVRAWLDIAEKLV